MIKVDRESKRIYLYVFDRFLNLVENSTYWSFDTLKEKSYRKVKNLCFVGAKSKFINGEEYFFYYSLTLYKIKSFDVFINLIEDGTIRLTFKIGVFYVGKRAGEIHDRGTSFDIKKSDFNKLYDEYKY